MSPIDQTVRYDLEKKTIHVPVWVDSELKPVTPPVAVPPGTWEVCWELDKESNKYAHFVMPGVKKCDRIDKKEWVPKLKLECKHVDGNCCPATLQNKVEYPNCCPIDLYIESHANKKLKFTHDPTIAVTADPYGDSGSLHERSEAGVVAERV